MDIKTVYAFTPVQTGTTLVPYVNVSKDETKTEEPYVITVRHNDGAIAFMYLSNDELLKMGLALVKEAAPDFALLGDSATIAAIKQMPDGAAS